MRKFITRGSYSLRSHECAPVGHCVFSLLQNDVSVSIGSQSDNGKEFHSFGDWGTGSKAAWSKSGSATGYALADRHERRSVSSDDLLQRERTSPGGSLLLAMVHSCAITYFTMIIRKFIMRT